MYHISKYSIFVLQPFPPLVEVEQTFYWWCIFFLISQHAANAWYQIRVRIWEFYLYLSSLCSRILSPVSGSNCFFNKFLLGIVAVLVLLGLLSFSFSLEGLGQDTGVAHFLYIIVDGDGDVLGSEVVVDEGVNVDVVDMEAMVDSGAGGGGAGCKRCARRGLSISWCQDILKICKTGLVIIATILFMIRFFNQILSTSVPFWIFGPRSYPVKYTLPNFQFLGISSFEILQLCASFVALNPFLTWQCFQMVSYQTNEGISRHF